MASKPAMNGFTLVFLFFSLNHIQKMMGKHKMLINTSMAFPSFKNYRLTGMELKKKSISQHTLALEKGMATYCSILALRIRWTEEPGGL